MKVQYDKEKCIWVVAHHNDFDGDLAKWKDSFYMLWRYQMTWSYAYDIEVNENRKNGTFVRLLIKPAYLDNILGAMNDLGYRNIEIFDAYVGVADGYEINTDIEAIVIDW